LSVDRECRCEAIADDSAADDVTQIINPLGIGTLRNRCLSGLCAMSVRPATWCRCGVAHDHESTANSIVAESAGV